MSDIVPDLSLKDIFILGKAVGFTCVEVMCWPPGKADRRYAGVTHLDVTEVDDQAAARVRHLVKSTGVAISGLGYYPNPPHPDPDHRRRVIEHLKKVISAAPRFDVRIVNTFVGRDPRKSVPE